MATILDDCLNEQNNGEPWIDCVAAGHEHDLDDPVEVRSLYRPVTDLRYTTVRRCRRCPVSIMSIPRS
jgi:hypothetical protein